MQVLPKNDVAGAIKHAMREHAAFDLKGVMASVTVLRLRSRDLNLIERQLRVKIAQLPQFFKDAPVSIDMGALDGRVGDFPLSALAHVLRSNGMIPVGISNLRDDDREIARAAGLGVLANASGPPKADATDADADQEAAAALSVAPSPPEKQVVATAEVPTKPSQAAAQRPPLVLRQPVRSGQMIYAQGTDLIVLASVNPGAQIFADGHIHVYSTLRGRAMAGAQGMMDARIFCQKLEAELVAIAGAYLTADDIPEGHRGKPSQVLLENGECRITAL